MKIIRLGCYFDQCKRQYEVCLRSSFCVLPDLPYNLMLSDMRVYPKWAHSHNRCNEGVCNKVKHKTFSYLKLIFVFASDLSSE